MPSSFTESYCAPLLKRASVTLTSAAFVNNEDEDIVFAKQRLQTLLTSLDKSHSNQVIKDAIQCLRELNPDQQSGLPAVRDTKDAEQEVLEKTLLNKLVVAMYAESLDTFLQQSVLAEKEAQWWDRISRSSVRTMFYLLQSTC